MAAFLAQRWRSQPKTSVAVDWGHPLAPSLLNVVNAVDGGGTQRARSSGSTLRAINNMLALSSGTYSSAQIRFSSAAVTNQTHVTVVVLTASTLGAARTVCETANNAIYKTGVSTDRAVFANVLNSAFGTTTQTGTASAMSVGATHVIAARFGAASGMSLFLNGRQTGSTGAAYTPYTTGGTTNAVTITGHSDCHTAASFFFDRQLSAAEIAAISENPWQFFQPARPIIYSLPAAAPTLSAATVTEIGTTTARPRVTVTFS